MQFAQVKRFRKKRPLKIELVVVALLSLACLADYFYNYNRIYPGVYLKSMHLGGKNLKEAQIMLTQLEVTFLDPSGRKTVRALPEMGVFPESEIILREGYLQGRGSLWPLNYLKRLRLAREKHFLSLKYRIDPALMRISIEKLDFQYLSLPEDAYYTFIGAMARLVPEKNGCRLKKQAFARLFLNHLDKNTWPLTMTVPLEYQAPKVTASALAEKGITNCIASYATPFEEKPENRVHNLRLAAAALNNHLIAPGEIFSFNSVVGESTVEKGYREANTIIAGEYVPGLGGGICQLSSTLYNAVLYANLRIVERHNHQIAVPYVPAGRDATVVYGSLDFRFRNDSGQWLLVAAEMRENQLTVGIFGEPAAQRVEIVTQLLGNYPPPVRYESVPYLPPGEEETVEGRPGCRVEVWRHLFSGSTLERREKISEDRYVPYPTVTRQGNLR